MRWIAALATGSAALAVAGCTSTPTTPSTIAPPQPMSTSVPGSVTTSTWIAAHDIPLDSIFRWPDLAAAAHSLTSPMFALERTCGSAPEPWRGHIESSGYTAQVAPFSTNGSGEGDWQGHELLVKPPGNGDDSIDGARSVFNSLTTELATCAHAPNGAQATITWNGDGPGNTPPSTGFSGLAAAITNGAMGELHDYLLVAYCHNTGTVAELALWATQPSQPWSAPADRTVLAAMNSALCSNNRQ